MLPMGKLVPGVALSDDVSGATPYGLSLGWRLDRRWFVRVYGVAAIGIPLSCGEGHTCGGIPLIVGAEAGYHFRDVKKRNQWDPWISLGLGYERLYLTSHVPPNPLLAGRGELYGQYEGIQYLNLQLGLDYVFAEPAKGTGSGWAALPGPDAIGLFVGPAAGDFLANLGGGNAQHGWFTMGVRMTWDEGRR
jgi:hypothetical protein